MDRQLEPSVFLLRDAILAQYVLWLWDVRPSVTSLKFYQSS